MKTGRNSAAMTSPISAAKDSEQYPRSTPSGTSHSLVTGSITPVIASFSVKMWTALSESSPAPAGTT